MYCIFEGYVRTLTYAILAYVNKNRVRAWQCVAIGNAFVLQTGIRQGAKCKNKRRRSNTLSLAIKTGSLRRF